MNYRTAEQKDLTAINEILARSFNAIYAYFARRSFSTLQNAIVAQDGSEITGAINYRIIVPEKEKIGYLYYLAVDPACRRQGIGKSLILRAASSIENEAGPVEIYAAVEKKNKPSRELLKSIGFAPLSRQAVREKYGRRRFELYKEMNLMPWEDLFVFIPFPSSSSIP
jgi:ribosomal protein S18 acetylase RimI-like enzyme